METRIDRVHGRRERRSQRDDPVGAPRRGLRLRIHHPLPGLGVGRAAERFVGAQSWHGYLIDDPPDRIAQGHRLASGIDAKIGVQFLGGPHAVETRGINHEGFTRLDPALRKPPSPGSQRVIGKGESLEVDGLVPGVEHLDPIPEGPGGIREDRRGVAHDLGDLQQAGHGRLDQHAIEPGNLFGHRRNPRLEPPRHGLGDRGAGIECPHHGRRQASGDLNAEGARVDRVGGECERQPPRVGTGDGIPLDERRNRLGRERHRSQEDPKATAQKPVEDFRRDQRRNPPLEPRSREPPTEEARHREPHNRLSSLRARRIQTALRDFSKAGEWF